MVGAAPAVAGPSFVMVGMMPTMVMTRRVLVFGATFVVEAALVEVLDLLAPFVGGVVAPVPSKAVFVMAPAMAGARTVFADRAAFVLIGAKLVTIEMVLAVAVN